MAVDGMVERDAVEWIGGGECAAVRAWGRSMHVCVVP